MSIINSEITAKRFEIIYITALALVCVLTVFIGIPSPLYNYQHDIFFFLDNAYRVAQGQIPHRDFSSAWGPLLYIIDATGLKIADMRPQGIGYATALFGALISAWSFILTRTICSSAVACAMGIYTLLLIVAPFSLGTSEWAFSVAMTYNRYAYAVFGLILVECIATALRMHSGIRQSMWGALSTGMALGLLTFLKISYALISLPVIVIHLFFHCRGMIRRILTLLAGFGFVTACVLWYLEFDGIDMLRDLAMAASARRLSLHMSKLFSIQTLLGDTPLLLMASLICKSRSGVFRLPAARVYGMAITLLTIAAGTCLLLSNQQESAYPLNAYAAVMLFAAAFDGSGQVNLPIKPGFAIKLVLLGICFLPLCMQSTLSLAEAAIEHEWPARARSTALTGSERGAYISFAPVEGKLKSEANGEEYIAALNDGLDLLRRRTNNDEGVLAIDMFNPFNYLLNRPSPTGGFAAAAYNYIFSAAFHPTPERFFGNTRYVMVRKYKKPAPDRVTEDTHVNGLLQIYGAMLTSDFSVVEETEHWVLWRRIAPNESSSGARGRT